MSKRVGTSDLLLGLFLCAVAATVLVAPRTLNFGTLTEMGAGFMPRVLSLVLMGFGVFFLGCAVFRRATESLGPIDWRALAGVTLAVAVFALTAGRFGLAIGSVLAILVAGAASRETRWRELVIFAVVMAAAAVLLFIKGLGLPVPVWPG